jgi:hypothetical protein
MALIHDDDLLCIDDAVCSCSFLLYCLPPLHLQPLESLRPDTVMSYLRKSAPKILQVECGEYMT